MENCLNTHYMRNQQAHRSFGSLGHKQFIRPYTVMCSCTCKILASFPGSLSLLLTGACGNKACKETTLVCLVIHDGVKLLSKCAPDGTVVQLK